MKIICSFFALLLFQEAISGIIRRPPVLLKPQYSNSYLPSVMQVIFHAVDQLKHAQTTENAVRSSTVASISDSPITHTTQSQETHIQETTSIDSETTTELANKKEDKEEETNDRQTTKMEENTTEHETDEEITEIVQQAENVKNEETDESTNHQELPEVNEEVPEVNYATPEINYEAPESVHGVQVTNQEIPEKNYESTSPTIDLENSSDMKTDTDEIVELKNTFNSTSNQPIKKEPTFDSIIEGIFEIVKPTPSEFPDETSEPTEESKSANGASVEKLENMEEENDENRYTLLGEKVTQVPRPSLHSYLKRTKVPLSSALQQLANLYDCLSKDARKQGFGKYTGYSDEILKNLQISAEGGIIPQLRKLLDKVMERNELTREDAKAKTREAIQDLDNSSSNLSKELRNLLPLRFTF